MLEWKIPWFELQSKYDRMGLRRLRLSITSTYANLESTMWISLQMFKSHYQEACYQVAVDNVPLGDMLGAGMEDPVQWAWQHGTY